MMHPYVGNENTLADRPAPGVYGCVAVRLDRPRLQPLRRAATPIKERGEVSKQKELPLSSKAGDHRARRHRAFDPLIGREKEVERIIQILAPHQEQPDPPRRARRR